MVRRWQIVSGDRVEFYHLYLETALDTTFTSDFLLLIGYFGSGEASLTMFNHRVSCVGQVVPRSDVPWA